jgi:hypothetical protein
MFHPETQHIFLKNLIAVNKDECVKMEIFVLNEHGKSPTRRKLDYQ